MISCLLSVQLADSILPPGASTIVKAKSPQALLPLVGMPVCLLGQVYMPTDTSPVGAHVWDKNNLAQKNISPRAVTAIADEGNFGNVCLGSFADELLTINNTSAYGSLNISNITSSSPDFLPPSVISYPLVVGTEDSINVVIRFQPTSFGPKSATLSIISNDPASPHTIAITGEAQVPRLVTLIANTGNFGKVCIGSFMDKPLILSNSGKCTLSVSNITLPLVSSLSQSVVLSRHHRGRNSLPVPIRFEPGGFGPKSATLTVNSDDPASPHTIDVSGERLLESSPSQARCVSGA